MVTESFSATLPFEDYLAANWLMVRRRCLWKGAARFLAGRDIAPGLVFAIALLALPRSQVSIETADALRDTSIVAKVPTGW